MQINFGLFDRQEPFQRIHSFLSAARINGCALCGDHLMTHLNVSIIGFGRMGQIYSALISEQVRYARLHSIVSRTSAAATVIEREYGVPHYVEVETVLADPAVDAVVVASPTQTHGEIVVAAANAGKAIFCEKPAALTLAETAAMQQAVDQKAAFCQIGFNRRYDEGFVAAHARIQQGEIGQPFLIRSLSRDPYRPGLDYLAHSGGILVDMGIHDFDVVRWLMQDEISTIYASGTTQRYPELTEVDDVDTAIASLHLSEGALGVVEVSRSAGYGYDIACEVMGTAGTLRIGYLQKTPLLTLNQQGVSHDVVPYFNERYASAYRAQITDFVNRVRQERPPFVSLADSYAALRISLAARQSLHQHAPINLPPTG